MRKTSVPSACSVNGSGNVITKSGGPSGQLPAGCWVLGAGCWVLVPGAWVSGAEVPGAGVPGAGVPGAPAAAHRWIRSISRSLNGCWPMNGPFDGSTFHGGMYRDRVTSAICRACRFASS